MAGTNVVAVKAEINARLVASAAPAMDGVQVLWSNAEQDLIQRKRIAWASANDKPRFTHTRSAASNTSRVPRTEVALYRVLVHVLHLGKGGAQQADTEAVAIGTVLEEILADAPNLGGNVPKLETVRVVGGEIETVRADEQRVYAELAYQLEATSRYIR